MATIFEIQQLALTLPEQERATLAANLLDSLPGVLSDEDEGVAEALRRDTEMNENPDQAICSRSWTPKSKAGVADAPRIQ